ncbi:MAG TPA: YSC84-related protein [Syntrophales bacterium]|nr:YSC84-related protein [Syntrophales bacterium]
MKVRMSGSIMLAIFILLIEGFLPAKACLAATAKEIDVSVDVALDRFGREVNGAQEYLKAAKGVLVIPNVVQAGFIFGGQFGEGALRIGGKTVDYYNIAAASVGFQIGAQLKDIILIFIDEAALQKFRNSDNWQAGVDGMVTVVNVGAEGSVDTTKTNQPIVGFVVGQKGLMAGVTIEGAKITKLKK